jgi:hypothetical protein
MALIDPSDPTYNWKCYAHDIGISVMNEYLAAQWFSTPDNQSNLNEWSDPSYAAPLLPDFLLGSGAVTSSQDIATLHSFLYYMAQVVLNFQGGPSPSAPYNSSSMFSAGSVWDLDGMRANGNNYSESRMLYLEAAGLTFNDNETDDPPLPNTCNATRYQVCPDFTAGSLHAYWRYFVGGTLYDYWAAIEDPTVSVPAYQSAYGNLPSQPTCENTDGLLHPCFGINREGESSEGSWYQYAMFRPVEAFNMMRTAGMNDPLLYGPQVSAGTSSFWDLKYISDLEFLTGPTDVLGGPSYAALNTGDTYTYWKLVTDAWTESSLLVSDSETGRTDRANALKWVNFNFAFGGPQGNLWNCTNYCGYDYQLTNGNFSAGTVFDMFLALPAGDPVASATPDPRPSLPTDLYNGSLNQHLMVRDNWTAGSNTLFTYWFNNSLFNHEYNFDGGFEIYAKGEYITKRRVIFNDYNWFMMMAKNQNTLSIYNSNGTGGTCPGVCSFWQAQLWANGGQGSESSQAGMVTLQHSELSSYVAALGDTTNAYNANSTGSGSSYYPSYNDVKAASRSIVYLRGSNQVVFYDRATVGHAASTQTLTQVTTGIPTISSNTASWFTRSGTQKAYFTTLLPLGGSLSNVGLQGPVLASWQAQDWEPASEVQVSPPGLPASSQFLSVLEWGSAGFTQSPTTLVQSTSGQNFDGALVGSSLVMFMRAWSSTATFTGVSYPASGATAQYVSDLIPSHIYDITGNGAPSTASTDKAGVLNFPATGTGLITITDPGDSSIAAPIITSTTTATGTVGIPFSYQITASNNPTFFDAFGLPDGLTIDPTSGAITGTPQAQGMYIVAISASNSGGTGTATLSITINPAGSGVIPAGSDLASMRVYPNPWRTDQHGGHPITFDQMGLGSDIKIFTVSGHKVKELNGSSGSVTWDLTNDSGSQVASGIYIYLVKDSEGNKAKGKLAVIR